MTPRILIVTSELVGPFRNGGIGTATTGLVETLAVAGLKPTVLYTGSISSSEAEIEQWVAQYAHIGVTLATLRAADLTELSGPVNDIGFGIPWLVWRFASAGQFDVIHLNDTMGQGYLCTAMKRLGLAFHQTLLVVGVHSPTRWILELNRQFPTSLIYAAFEHAERISIQTADRVWAPSHYMSDWLERAGFMARQAVAVRPYVIPSLDLFDPDKLVETNAGFARPATGIKVPLREIVFFGRLEERKGLKMFADAIEQMAPQLAAAAITVVFLGKSVPIDCEDSAGWLARRGAAWPFSWRIEGGLGRQEAVRWLMEGGRLAVMASPFDNSPCTVYEALRFGFPLLASDAGGIPELIAEHDRARTLFCYGASSLADALVKACREGISPAAAVMAAEQSAEDWLALHENWREQLPVATTGPAVSPIVSALIDHTGDDAALAVTLDALRGLGTVGKIVILDRANQPLQPVAGECSIIRSVGAETVDCLRHALSDAGPWTLFIRAGARLDPAAMALVYRALSHEATTDVILPGGRGPDGRIIPPFGGSLALGFFQGTTFPGGAVVSERAIAGALTLLDRPLGSSFAGLVDAMLVADCRTLPLAAAVFELSDQPVLAEPVLDPARTDIFARSAASELFHVMAIGYAAFTEDAGRSLRRQIVLRVMGLPGGSTLVTMAKWGLTWKRRLRKKKRLRKVW